MRTSVTVAIPTLDAGAEFERLLGAVTAQRVDRDLELLVCDSGSSDATVARARGHGARVLEIDRASFSHGGTRNLLMKHARGAHVAFLTQDSVPAADDWLARLLAAFELVEDVGLAFGPYRPRPDASPSVARELTVWFESFSEGGPRVDALPTDQRASPARALLGQVGYFTDANGCVARSAWERVPFREVAYAEDHLLAHDMLRAGYAKVFVPDAAVIHSHEYSPLQWLRRSFDEARATQEIYGWAVSGDLRSAMRNLRGNVVADWRWRSRHPSPNTSGPDRGRAFAGSLAHHVARGAGAFLGARADRLPASAREVLSLERRD